MNNNSNPHDEQKANAVLSRNNCAYQRRLGKMSHRQKSLLAHSQSLIPTDQYHDIPTTFNKKQPIHCEIGFGKGHYLIKQALQHPHINYVGIDLYLPGIACVLGAIEDHNIDNLKLINHDALEIFVKYMPKDSLDHIDILHPDPWPKKRHHKRRLITKNFLELVLQALNKDCVCRIVSDDADYTLWIKEIITQIKAPYEEIQNIEAFTKYGNRATRIQNTITGFNIMKES